MKKLLNVLLYIWQLPQTILGWILLKIYGWEYRELKRFPRVKIYFCPKFPGGISLGKYILINPKYNGEDMNALITRHHEYGHCVQSMMLGPFYLLIVGLWSALRARFNLYKKGCYYKSFPENWADKLGGVKTDSKNRRYVEQD